jgi:hypothetical protein
MRVWRYIAWTLAAIINIPLIALLCTTRYSSGAGLHSVGSWPFFSVSWGNGHQFHISRGGLKAGRNFLNFPLPADNRMEIQICTWANLRAARDRFYSNHPAWHWSLRRPAAKPPPKSKIFATGRREATEAAHPTLLPSQPTAASPEAVSK